MFSKAPYYGRIFLLAGMCVLSVFAHVLVLLLASGVWGCRSEIPLLFLGTLSAQLSEPGRVSVESSTRPVPYTNPVRMPGSWLRAHLPPAGLLSPAAGLGSSSAVGGPGTGAGPGRGLSSAILLF